MTSIYPKLRKRSPADVFVRGKPLADLLNAHPVDLSRTDLSEVLLTGVNLRHCNLYKSVLRGCDLERADLSGSNLSLADFTGSNLFSANLAGAELDSTVLNKSDLQGAKFTGTELFGTELQDANLVQAEFTNSVLRDVDLAGANLTESSLERTRLLRSNLGGACLERAHLFETEIRACSLVGTRFDSASFSQVLLTEVDLSQAVGLEKVFHESSTAIGIEVLFLSRGRIPKTFLLRAGVPDTLVDYLDSLLANPLEFNSCFISYSAADDTFARRLYNDLVMSGIRCWLFVESAKWGEPLWQEIDRSIHVHDRVVVICSESSLNSQPVIREIERALQREDKENRNILFPIRIDPYVFEWQHFRKSDVLAKVVGNFTDWTDPTHYRQSFLKLKDSLKRPVQPEEQQADNGPLG